MDPPRGFNPKEGKLCKLKTSLYGLKQLLRAWFGKLSYAMKQAMANRTLFFKRDDDGTTLLIVYVVMIVTSSNTKETEKLQSHLK